MKRTLFIFLILVVIIEFACHQSYEIIDGSFGNEGITFACHIYKPAGKGPFPSVIMLHGSKNHTKDFYTEYSKYFASHGVVTLNYDNRGHGDSEGNLWTADFSNLAGDAIAALKYAAGFDFVNKDKTGFWADSHGGWIALIADSLSAQVDFIVSKAGPVVTPLHTVLYDIEQNYMQPGIDEKMKNRILQLYPKIFSYLARNRSSQLWQTINKELLFFEKTPYFKQSFDQYYRQLLQPPSEIPPVQQITLAPSGRDFDFEPLPYLENMHTRMLLIYGTGDRLIPVHDCIQIIQYVNNPFIELKVYPDADHGIRLQRKPALLFSPRFPEDYLDKLVTFIKEEE